MGDQILIRMDPALKEQLARIAKMEGRTSSEIIRALVEDYLRQRDVGAYVDALWEKFGKDFKARKLTARDITAAIKASRKSRKENAGRR